MPRGLTRRISLKKGSRESGYDSLWEVPGIFDLCFLLSCFVVPESSQHAMQGLSH